jgi:hypothetical protein
MNEIVVKNRVPEEKPTHEIVGRMIVLCEQEDRGGSFLSRGSSLQVIHSFGIDLGKKNIHLARYQGPTHFSH